MSKISKRAEERKRRNKELERVKRRLAKRVSKAPSFGTVSVRVGRDAVQAVLRLLASGRVIHFEEGKEE